MDHDMLPGAAFWFAPLSGVQGPGHQFNLDVPGLLFGLPRSK
jgi:hypothetical protein